MKDNNSLAEFRVYQHALELSQVAWRIHCDIPKPNRYSIGDQFIRSIDSIGANIAEGYGRYTFKERLNFIRIARGSLYEAVHWTKLISSRFNIAQSLTEQLNKDLNPQAILLNQYARYLKSKLPQ